MNVKDALQLGDLQKAKILAGDKGLDRVIKAAEVMEVPDINEWLTEGILIISTFYSVKDDPEAQLSMFRKLIEVNGAGLILKMGRYVHELPEEMMRLANEENMPIMTIPVNVSFVHLLTVLFESKFKEAQTEEETLLEQIYHLGEVGDLHVFVQELAEMTSGNIVIEDKHNRLLAYANQKPFSERRTFTLFSEPKRNSSRSQTTMRIMFNQYSVVLELPQQDKLWRAVLQKASAFLEGKITFLFEKCAGKVNRRLEQDEKQLKEFLTNHSDVMLRYGVVACNHEAFSLTYSPLHQAIFFSNFYSYVENHLPSFFCVQKQETIYLLYTQERYQARRDMISSIQLLKGELVMNMALHLKMGISPEYQDRSLVDQAFSEANTASNYTEHTDGITLYEEVDYKQMMTKLANEQEVERFADRMLQPLIASHTKDEALLQTLMIFLRENGNHSKTAEMLYVHRRTLKYRLEKIEQRMMLDLNDSENRFLLYFALKIKGFL
ncbi:DNA-binding PucR family transcriptional regulator [Alkalihalobacillus xiaoxiensis]|uniref:DNA-binding PucR family transcriptional regulator n=1 Tax=Shouchella xiaoxiensis TaxID=766895 RepID=A0ABS2SNN5_9BACI|nr:PucR family transcriptional regulator [Shouchella xiaoxiensis]MBM7837127.1 DNA-binding PucR family transcriptional regulator [Shouchella xiaoxiensis]